MFWGSAGLVVSWVWVGRVQYSALALRKKPNTKKGEKNPNKSQPIPTFKVETCINLHEFPWLAHLCRGWRVLPGHLWCPVKSVHAICVCTGNEEQGGILLLTAAVITLLSGPSLKKPVIYMWFKWMKMQFKGLLWCPWESMGKLPLTQPGFYICPQETTSEPGKWYRVCPQTDGFWNHSASYSFQLSLFSKESKHCSSCSSSNEIFLTWGSLWSGLFWLCRAGQAPPETNWAAQSWRNWFNRMSRKSSFLSAGNNFYTLGQFCAISLLLIFSLLAFRHSRCGFNSGCCPRGTFLAPRESFSSFSSAPSDCACVAQGRSTGSAADKIPAKLLKQLDLGCAECLSKPPSWVL